MAKINIELDTDRDTPESVRQWLAQFASPGDFIKASGDVRASPKFWVPSDPGGLVAKLYAESTVSQGMKDLGSRGSAPAEAHPTADAVAAFAAQQQQTTRVADPTTATVALAAHPTITVPDELAEHAGYTGPVDPSEVDADGLPWDERIHSSSRAKLVDGRWRQRRNTPAETVKAVEAELRARLAPLPPTFAAPPPPPAPVAAEPPVVVVPPPPPPAPAQAPEVLTDTPAPVALTLAQVMPSVTAAMSSGDVTMQTIQQTLEGLGVANGLPGLRERPDLIPAFLLGIGVAYG